MDDLIGKSLMPDPDSVSPSHLPAVPAPVPILMPSPGKGVKTPAENKTGPKPETTKDNLQYK